MTSLGEELTKFLEASLDEKLQPRPEPPPIMHDLGKYYNIIFDTPTPDHTDIYDSSTDTSRVCKDHFIRGTKMILSKLTGLEALIKTMKFWYEHDIDTYTAIMVEIELDIETIQTMMRSYETLYKNVVKHFSSDAILNQQRMTYTSVMHCISNIRT